MRRAVLLFVLLVSSSASAEKSPKKAKLLAGLGVGLSSGLVLSSVLINVNEGTVYKPTFYAGVGTSIVTPSLGHWYAGKWLTVGMGVRAGAALLAVYGITRTQDQPCDVDPTENCPTLTGTGFTVLALAAIGYIGGVAYDLFDTPRSVERYNRLHVTLAPTASDRSAGLALVGRW